MRKTENGFILTATDLVGFLNCRHLTTLDRAVAEGTLEKPKVWDPLLQILSERGAVHEREYVEHLETEGLTGPRIEGTEVTPKAVGATLAAMKDGASIIVQGALAHDGWVGRVDILRRVEVASDLGPWSYEPIDTKLARETKAGTVLQLCLYGDLLTQAQGIQPEHMHVVVPWSEYTPERYRYTDYAAYFRKVKSGLRDQLAQSNPAATYPEPIAHCDICRWRVACDKRRRDDDHLCLVAGISKVQINELRHHNVSTVQALAAVPLPLEWKPDRGSIELYARVREQARIQVEARESGEPKFELLPVQASFGLTRLPEPSEGDIFLDLEGDPFVGEHGLEYLFGWTSVDDKGAPVYDGVWATSRSAERRAFEEFVDFVMARWEKFPALHIYHYAPYEPAALKRLMGRYATREDEIDRMLRAGLFVDLYHVVRHALRAGIESYSIKQLEPLYAFNRDVSLGDANVALANLQAALEANDAPSIAEDAMATVLGYNRDDCQSAAALRDWLERLRAQLVTGGTEVPRPPASDGAPPEDLSEWMKTINALMEKLTAGVPDDPGERTEEEQARWILANVLDWHRREEKAVWWELFRLSDLSAEDLLDERAGLSGMTFVEEVVGGTAKAPIHRYRFPPQETEIRSGDGLRNLGGAQLGTTVAISQDDRTIDIKKRQDSIAVHPEAIFAHTFVRAQAMKDALVRLGNYVADHGLQGDGPYQAARDLLLRRAPRVGGAPLRQDGEPAVAAATRLCATLDGGILPIQGPPGAGKTFTAAQMICELVRQGKSVGVTANSHKVIRLLVDGTIEAADKQGVDLQCRVKSDEVEPPQHRLSFARNNAELIDGLGAGVDVGGGTAWLWATPEVFEKLDVLFVDEAAQMSLANVLAVSQAARTVVLIGDPQQLDQPTQATHPDGTGVSALDHILAGAPTIPPDRGLFLDQTWRLHPDICSFTSELFYDGKLRSRDGLGQQVVDAEGILSGAGLRFLPVNHHGNQNSAPEEAEAVAALVNSVLSGNSTWTNRDGAVEALTLDDIVIITPYNAQVFEIQQQVPGARVGTVDKFQGQEAPIAIYSTATSSHADAPRGMEFLYSLNRLNVATSRAKCISVIVSSPQIFEADCRTPRQVQLANAFCRYLELADLLTIATADDLWTTSNV